MSKKVIQEETANTSIDLAAMRHGDPQSPVGDEIAGYLHRVLEEPTFYAADNIHIVDGMPLYLESAVSARDQQIAALQTQIADLEEALKSLDKGLTDKGLYLGVQGERMLARALKLAQQVTK